MGFRNLVGNFSTRFSSSGSKQCRSSAVIVNQAPRWRVSTTSAIRLCRGSLLNTLPAGLSVRACANRALIPDRALTVRIQAHRYQTTCRENKQYDSSMAPRRPSPASSGWHCWKLVSTSRSVNKKSRYAIPPPRCCRTIPSDMFQRRHGHRHRHVGGHRHLGARTTPTRQRTLAKRGRARNHQGQPDSLPDRYAAVSMTWTLTRTGEITATIGYEANLIDPVALNRRWRR